MILIFHLRCLCFFFLASRRYADLALGSDRFFRVHVYRHTKWAYCQHLKWARELCCVVARCQPWQRIGKKSSNLRFLTTRENCASEHLRQNRTIWKKICNWHINYIHRKRRKLIWIEVCVRVEEPSVRLPSQVIAFRVARSRCAFVSPTRISTFQYFMPV